MARKGKNAWQAQQNRVLNNQRNLQAAQEWLEESPLAPLLKSVSVEISADAAGPEVAAVDPARGVLLVNVRACDQQGHAYSSEAWQWVVGHLLLHLAFNHPARREDRDPLLWNAACDLVCARTLYALDIGSCPFPREVAWGDFPQDASEETIYDLMAGPGGVKPGDVRTLSGRARPDITGLDGRSFALRKDWEAAFLEGLQYAARRAVAEAAEAAESEARGGAKNEWPPAVRVRRWVERELPLLASLAAEIRVIADARVCDSMAIHVAAVNAFLGEMYLHPDCPLTDEELRFVYVHELLHVALFHHDRLLGRDPFVWNLACDFVINAWLVEMGVGALPKIGALYDPRLSGMGAEEVYDLLIRDLRRCRSLRGFRGKLGDILLDAPHRRIYRDEVTTLDDVYRQRLRAGYRLWSQNGRGLVPAALLEEIKSLFTPPVPWDVELARWMARHVPLMDEFRRSYARASRRQASTPDIPRAARYIPQEVKDACTFGVVLDTSGSMDRQLLGRALGAIASYAESRDVPAVRLILCDAAPYDKGYLAPTDLRGIVAVQGRGGTVLQPGIGYLLSRHDFPATAPVMILTDGWCEEEILCPREHCFVLPRKSGEERAGSLRTSAPVFRVLKATPYDD
jgi:Predicted metallopeptidase (DUF2201).